MASAETPCVDAHHESLYFPDGDVVLSAKNDDGSKLFFRVHKFILSLHSPVFKDMFSLPTPREDSVQRYDGVSQVVEMSDRPDDLASLLLALYQPTTLPYKRYNPDMPLLVKGILTLATKYQFDTMRDRIIEQIKYDWPTTLHEWDAIETYNKHFWTSLNSGDIVNREIIQLEPAAAIEIAMLFDIPSILPAAFLQLFRTHPHSHWDNSELPHGYRLNHARWNLVSRDSLLRLMHGTRLLHSAVKQVAESPYFGHDGCPQRCMTPLICGKFLERQFSILFRHSPNIEPFHALESLTAKISLSSELCPFCVGDIPNYLRKQRKMIWDKLPIYFNL
ncbi:hypothetical protein BD410DRAFT_180950 [Rickenella mellea]|uniref:BTB domain-containing protein n=1 Tax=Rickenella mellea TaxID=50990 RepID=A0A4Y7PHS1_9AGAM|nr:hypothetical protein BD410DRAFT_180950 [Rickenella mellea]